MNITMWDAEAIADNADATLYPDYSGRSMYGSQCVGFSVRGGNAESRVTRAIVRSLDDAFADEMLSALRTDSLGLGVVVYFPGITLDGE